MANAKPPKKIKKIVKKVKKKVREIKTKIKTKKAAKKAAKKIPSTQHFRDATRPPRPNPKKKMGK
jgi:signal recognition particle receptor subunit beta